MKMTTRCYEDDSDDLTMRELLLLADEQQTEPSRELVERTRTALHQRRTGLASPVATWRLVSDDRTLEN